MNAFVVVGLLGVALGGFVALPGSAKPDARALGDHSLKGVYEFHPDGVVEVNGEPTRGFWETSRFEADGKGNMLN